MAKSKVNDAIEWVDKKTNNTLRGIVRSVHVNSVVVDIDGTDEATVVSHKRYEVVSTGNGENVKTLKTHPLRRTFPAKNTKKKTC